MEKKINDLKNDILDKIAIQITPGHVFFTLRVRDQLDVCIVHLKSGITWTSVLYT